MHVCLYNCLIFGIVYQAFFWAPWWYPLGQGLYTTWRLESSINKRYVKAKKKRKGKMRQANILLTPFCHLIFFLIHFVLERLILPCSEEFMLLLNPIFIINFSFYIILINLQRISVNIILLLRCNDLSFSITYVFQ